MPGLRLIGGVWQEKVELDRPPREVEPRVSGWEGGRAPQQPDFTVWLQERHRAEPNGSERGRGRSFRARFVVLTTILQSRIMPPGDGAGGREARSQWYERLVRAGGAEPRKQSTDDNIGKPRPPCSLVPA